MALTKEQRALLGQSAVRALLDSTIPARVAYRTRRPGVTVVPVWFLWSAESLVISGRANAQKVRAIQANSEVSASIDSGDFPYRCLQLWGHASVEIVDGVVEEYAACAKRYLGDQGGRAWIDAITPTFPPMARITIRPELVKYLDLRAHLPALVQAVESAGAVGGTTAARPCKSERPA